MFINFFNTVNMYDDFEDTMIPVKEGAIAINKSVSKDGDYNLKKATKIRKNFDDGTTQITQAPSTITNGVCTYQIYFYSVDGLNSIDIISEDESTTYITIPITPEGYPIGRCCRISQTVRIE